MKIGKHIRRLRKEQNMSQAELAKKIGISRSYLSELESDKRNVGIDTVQRLAEKLGVTPSYLLEGTKGAQDYEKSGEFVQLAGDWDKNFKIMSSEMRSDLIQQVVEELSLMSLPNMNDDQVTLLGNVLHVIRSTKWPQDVDDAIGAVNLAFMWAFSRAPRKGKTHDFDEGNSVHEAIFAPLHLIIAIYRAMESAGYVVVPEDRVSIEQLEKIVKDHQDDI